MINAFYLGQTQEPGSYESGQYQETQNIVRDAKFFQISPLSSSSLFWKVSDEELIELTNGLKVKFINSLQLQFVTNK